MPEDPKFDVFLSHSAKDKTTVRALAERMRAAGLRVWFDEWEIKVGDSIPAKIEAGLEDSAFLVLCMARHDLPQTHQRTSAKNRTICQDCCSTSFCVSRAADKRYSLDPKCP